MSRKHKYKHRPTGVPAAHMLSAVKPGPDVPSSAPASVPVREEPELIRDLLAHGKVKPALERAKEYHKRAATPASEALLVDAYLARVRALLESGLREEAIELNERIKSAIEEQEVDELAEAVGALKELLYFVEGRG